MEYTTEECVQQVIQGIDSTYTQNINTLNAKESELIANIRAETSAKLATLTKDIESFINNELSNTNSELYNSLKSDFTSRKDEMKNQIKSDLEKRKEEIIQFLATGFISDESVKQRIDEIQTRLSQIPFFALIYFGNDCKKFKLSASLTFDSLISLAAVELNIPTGLEVYMQDKQSQSKIKFTDSIEQYAKHKDKLEIEVKEVSSSLLAVEQVFRKKIVRNDDAMISNLTGLLALTHQA